MRLLHRKKSGGTSAVLPSERTDHRLVEVWIGKIRARMDAQEFEVARRDGDLPAGTLYRRPHEEEYHAA